MINTVKKQSKDALEERGEENAWLCLAFPEVLFKSLKEERGMCHVTSWGRMVLAGQRSQQ